MRVLFVGDAISGKLILEGIDKVGTLVALAIPDRDLKSLINTEIPTIHINRINEISVVDFDHADVVRHPLVSKIVKAYNNNDQG